MIKFFNVFYFKRIKVFVGLKERLLAPIFILSLLCAFLIGSSRVYAINVSSNISGEAQFLSQEEDDLEFIKSELVYRAFLDIITKKLSASDLNAELFWQKFDTKFKKSFESKERVLKEKYFSSADAQVESADPKRREDFQVALRKKRILSKRKFGNLKRILKSYSIDKLSRSARNPKLRFIRISAKIDEESLLKTYYLFVQGKKVEDYGTLFLESEIDLQNLSYAQIGVQNENEFKSVITNAWINDLSKKRPSNIADVKLIDDNRRKELNDYLKLPLNEVISSTPEKFKNSLYLKINLSVNKIKFEEKINNHLFEFSGTLYLQELKGARILSSVTLKKSEKSFALKDTTSGLKNLIASYLYGLPRSALTSISSRIRSLPPVTSIQKVGLNSFENTGQVHKFMNSLETYGLKLSLKTKLSSLSRNFASILVYYDGTAEELSALLDKISQFEKEEGGKFDVIDNNGELSIKYNHI